jgi:hypothetical protein
VAVYAGWRVHRSVAVASILAIRLARTIWRAAVSSRPSSRAHALARE